MSGPAPRLGRGLASLLGEATAPSANRTALPVAQLEPGPFQPRQAMDPAALADLTASIKQQGVLQPILARPHPKDPSRYQIIAGERRWRAATAAGLHEVPVLVRPLSDSESMAAALVENLQRQDLDAIEEADGYMRLASEFGLTQENLATLLGKSRSHIANTVRLLNLPPAIRRHVQTGALTAGHARALLNHGDPIPLADHIIARGLNVRQAEALANRRPAPAKPTADAAERERVGLERHLSLTLGLKVTITTRGAGGAMHINYRNFDQLDMLIDRLRILGPSTS